MRGKPLSREKIEEIHALSIVFTPKEISVKAGVPLRTVYAALQKPASPAVVARREEKEMELIDDAWEKAKAEASQIDEKCKLILNAIDKERMGKARIVELTTAYGTLFDKRQLLIGKPTNIGFSVSAIVEAIHERRKQRKPEDAQEGAVVDVTPQGSQEGTAEAEGGTN